VRKDLGVFFGRLDDVLDLVSLIGVMHRGGVDYGIFVVVVGAHGQDGWLGSVDMQPLGKEQIDLVNVFLEGGVAGGVVLDIVGGAQTLAGVEGMSEGLRPVLRRVGCGLFGRGEGKRGRARPCSCGGGGQQQLRQLLIAEDVEDKNREDEGENDGSRIQNAAQPLPALSLRVEKYLSIGHEWA